MTTPLTAIERIKADLASFIRSKWIEAVDNFVESILAIGARLLEDKARIPHGDFLDALKTVRFPEDTAEKLMAIARHPVLSDSAVRRNLPPAYTTLYELSRAPVPLLREALEAGAITPDLKEHQARKLWRDVPDRDRGELYAIFACASCGERKLRGEESRPSVLGEDAEARPRLYECDSCGKTTLTEERVIGPFGKKSLPKTGRQEEARP